MFFAVAQLWGEGAGYMNKSPQNFFFMPYICLVNTQYHLGIDRIFTKENYKSPAPSPEQNRNYAAGTL